MEPVVSTTPVLFCFFTMTATSNQILTASIGGSVELLTLSSAGALLVYLGLFEPAVSSALSKGKPLHP